MQDVYGFADNAIHTYIHAYIHTYIRTNIHADNAIHTYMHTDNNISIKYREKYKYIINIEKGQV